MTRQRQLIHEIICSSMEHLTAEEIYFEAKKRLPKIAVGTVYRNLKQMEEEDEIRKISIPGGPDRYDRSVIPHEHIRCSVCGHLKDLPDLDMQSYLSEKLGEKVHSYRLDITYICTKCKNSDI